MRFCQFEVHENNAIYENPCLAVTRRFVMPTKRTRSAIVLLRNGARGYAIAAFQTLFIFGFLVWMYVVLIQVTRPDFLTIPLTHHELFPLNMRVDDTGLVGFVVSAVSFFGWRLLHRR